MTVTNINKLQQNIKLSSLGIDLIKEKETTDFTKGYNIKEFWEKLRRFLDEADKLKDSYQIKNLVDSLRETKNHLTTNFANLNTSTGLNLNNSTLLSAILSNFDEFVETVKEINKKAVEIDNTPLSKGEDNSDNWIEVFLEGSYDIIVNIGAIETFYQMMSISRGKKTDMINNLEDYQTRLSLVLQSIKLYYLQNDDYWNEKIHREAESLYNTIKSICDTPIDRSDHNKTRTQFSQNHKGITSEIKYLYQNTFRSKYKIHV
jgi:hypothetical protein